MLFDRFLWPGVLVPAAAALVALAATFLVDRRRRGSTVGGASLAVGAGLVAGFVALGGWPRWPPVDSTQRIFYLAAAAAVAGLAWGWWRERRSPWALRGGLLGLLLVLVLQSPLQNTWSRAEAVVWLAALFALGLAVGWSIDAALAAAGWRSALVRLTLLGGTAALLALSGSLRLAQLLGAAACAAAVVELVGPRAGRRPWLPADSMVLTVAVLGFLLTGYFFAALEPVPAALAAAAWVLAGPAARGAGWRRGLALVPLLAALAWAGYAVATEPADPYDLYGAGGPGRPVAEGNIAAAGA